MRQMQGVVLATLVFLGGCQATVSPPSLSYRHDDASADSLEEQDDTCRSPYRYNAALAGYNSRTAMTDELGEFWAEDQRFYEDRMAQHCDD